MPVTDVRCVMRFRVPYCDVDMMQHVNHAAYIVWVETVRCNYFAEVLKEPLNGANGMILARAQLEYAQPLDYREDVAAAVACRTRRFDHVCERLSGPDFRRCAREMARNHHLLLGRGASIVLCRFPMLRARPSLGR